jgi:hypothetical protein
MASARKDWSVRPGGRYDPEASFAAKLEGSPRTPERAGATRVFAPPSSTKKFFRRDRFVAEL